MKSVAVGLVLATVVVGCTVTDEALEVTNDLYEIWRSGSTEGRIVRGGRQPDALSLGTGRPDRIVPFEGRSPALYSGGSTVDCRQCPEYRKVPDAVQLK